MVSMKRDVFSILEEGYSDPIRDPLWGHVYLTPALAELTKTKPFLRLSRILQLGPTFLLYPGATHTRAAHSIGVYHLARRLARVLAEGGADTWMTPTGVLSFLAAALLHDLGHFPYTHSLKELELRDHESLTAQIILSESLKKTLGEAGADPYLSAAIVDTSLPAGKEGEALFYRKLLSGVLDPDKLDYLNRDARYCGVPYGAQDVDFTFSRLTPHRDRGADIDSRGIPNVEAILFAKYLMYRTVYWHRTVRSATAMVKKALMAGLNSKTLKKEELYNLDDQSLFMLLARGGHPYFALADLVRRGALFETLAEFPFSPESMGILENLSLRDFLETELARRIGKALSCTLTSEDLILDLPEPISFETGLYINDEERNFSQSSTIFHPSTVQAFTGALRVVRIFITPELNQKRLEPQALEELLHSSIGSIHL